MAMTYYIVEIDTLLEKMFSLKSLVPPANRRFIEQYLHSTWSLITELTTGFRRAEWNDLMREKFQAYVSQQEKEMRGRLEKVRYDIDAADTLLLVTGPGRIEKVRFTYLLRFRSIIPFPRTAPLPDSIPATQARLRNIQAGTYHALASR